MNVTKTVLPTLLFTLMTASAQTPQFPDSAYTIATPEGRLECNGQIVRHWGFIGWVVPGGQPQDKPTDAAQLEKDRRAIDLMVKRIADLGFTSIRLWEGPDDTTPYTMGDGSRADLLAYYLWKLDQAGIKVWVSILNNVGHYSTADAGVIDDPQTADAWSAAVAELMARHNNAPLPLRCGHGDPNALARSWDPRLEALGIARMRELAEFPNHYKGGLRMCDDPQNIVWELSNEEMWFWGMFPGRWQELPAFFRNQLAEKWNDFLRVKYTDDEALARAWKFVLPGESLADGTVLLAPLAGPVQSASAVNDTNPAVAAALRRMPQTITRDDVTRQRGADAVEFLTTLYIDHKKRETAALKTWGRSCALSTVTWEAGNCFQIQSQWMFSQPESGAVSSCAYVSGMEHDPTTKRFPFWSGLESPPRLCWDVPWLEQSKVKGKPHFVYEIQIANKTKYRAEFPARVAAFASLQDWSIINWHIYGHAADPARENPFDEPLMIWHDYFGYASDEVQCSAMRAAAAIFTKNLLPRIENPTTFIFGKRSLFAPESMDYGKSYGDYGKKFIPTAYRHGVQVVIDPTREHDEIIGPSINQGVFEPNPVRPTDAVAYDWQRGHLMFDASGVAGYTGFFAQYGAPEITFKNGAIFRDIRVVNPPDMPYPVADDELYVALALTAIDGDDLATCQRAELSAVSTSFNTKQFVDVTQGSRGMHQHGPDPDGPREFAGAWVETGTAPVLVARVGVTVQHPGLAGMTYTLRDWHLRAIGTDKVGADGAFTLSPDQPAFVVEFDR